MTEDEKFGAIWRAANFALWVLEGKPTPKGCEDFVDDSEFSRLHTKSILETCREHVEQFKPEYLKNKKPDLWLVPND